MSIDAAIAEALKHIEARPDVAWGGGSVVVEDGVAFLMSERGQVVAAMPEQRLLELRRELTKGSAIAPVASELGDGRDLVR